MIECIISTSRLNAYGSRVLTEGIDTTQYEKNPILLWMHQRPFEGGPLPIGHVENLRTDGDALIGTPVFDMDDAFAAEIARKWEHGDLKMVSAGLEIVATSQDAADLLPGQTRPTITKCRLIEVSVVDIGANDDALQLYHEGALVELAAGLDRQLPLLQTPNNDDMLKEQLITLLELPEEAVEQDILDTVATLRAESEELTTLRRASIERLVDGAIAEHRIDASARDHFIALGDKTGYDSLSETLSLVKPHGAKPSEFVKPTSTTAPTRYEKLSDIPAEEFEQFKADNPMEYAALYRKEYGVDLTVDE